MSKKILFLCLSLFMIAWCLPNSQKEAELQAAIQLEQELKWIDKTCGRNPSPEELAEREARHQERKKNEPINGESFFLTLKKGKHNCSIGENNDIKCKKFQIINEDDICEYSIKKPCIKRFSAYAWDNPLMDMSTYFPLAKYPKNKNINEGTEPPIYGNRNIIFFNKWYNNDYLITKDTSFILEGKISKDIKNVEIIRDGDFKGTSLKRQAESVDFSYPISFEHKNLSYGENNYLIRGYNKGRIYERVFRYFLVNPDEPAKQMSKIENFNGLGGCFQENLCREKKQMSHYTQEKKEDHTEYELGYNRLYFWPQILELDNGITISHKNVFEEMRTWGFAMLEITTPEGESVSKRINPLNGNGLEVAKMKQYPDGTIIFTDPGRESSDQVYIYVPAMKEIFNLDEDIVKTNLKEDYYPTYTTEKKGNTIITREMPYCPSDIDNPKGYEEIIYDINSQELLSRRPLPEISKI